MKTIDYLFILLGFAVGFLIHKSETQSLSVENKSTECVVDTLTEWQMLQLAIAYTESKFDPSAVGSSEDLGILQIRPIYAREASRISHNMEYTHSDALDSSKSLEMFNLVQDYHNPKHDMDKAIALHNRANWYKRRVLENLEFIRRMEAARAIVLNYE